MHTALVQYYGVHAYTTVHAHSALTNNAFRNSNFKTYNVQRVRETCTYFLWCACIHCMHTVSTMQYSTLVCNHRQQLHYLAMLNNLAVCR